MIENRASLVLRLSGPLQSWGEHSPYAYRNTIPYPTYSGILGMARAALGIKRETDPMEWEWLRNLRILVRIDSQGDLIRDYQTINPPPANHWDGSILVGNKSEEPHTVPTGGGKAWLAQGEPATMLVTKEYLTDAVFIVIFEGEGKRIADLASAFQNPKWVISLGRKASIPDWPFYLGISELKAEELLEQIPLPIKPNTKNKYFSDKTEIKEKKEKVVFHNLTPNLNDEGSSLNSKSSSIYYVDNPLGSHPHNGYVRNKRTTHTISISNPRQNQAEWAKNQLSLDLE